jgi:hypothetical protein
LAEISEISGGRQRLADAKDLAISAGTLLFDEKFRPPKFCATRISHPFGRHQTALQT